MKDRSGSCDSMSSSSSEEKLLQDQVQALESELMQAASELFDDKTQNVVFLLVKFMRQIEKSVLQRIRTEKLQSQDNVGKLEDADNTWLNRGCEQLESFPKVSVPQSTPDVAKPHCSAPRTQSSTSCEQQVPSAKDIAFKKQVVPEPHTQTCPQPTWQAYFAAKRSSATLAVLPSTRPLPSSDNAHPPDPMNGSSIKSAQTMSKLPLWLRPRSTELKEYEKRVAASSKPQESKCAPAGSVNSLSTLPCASVVAPPYGFSLCHHESPCCS